MHVAAELRAADVPEEPVPGQERGVHLRRTERGPERQVQVRQQAEHEPGTGPDEQPRRGGKLTAGVDQHEQDHERHDRDGQAVVRHAQPGQQRTEQEVARAAFGAPHQRPMEEQRDEQQVEPVHLGERGFLPERAREGQRQPGPGGDHRADAEPDEDQDRDADRSRGSDRRQQVGPIRHRPDRDQA